MGRKRKSEKNTSYFNELSNSSGSSSHLSLVQRSAANDRERTRMRVLSKAFVRLKTCLPWVPTDTKLSKLDTLKLATSYITYLTKILHEDDQESLININEPMSEMLSNLKSNINDIRNNLSEKKNIIPSFKTQNRLVSLINNIIFINCLKYNFLYYKFLFLNFYCFLKDNLIVILRAFRVHYTESCDNISQDTCILKFVLKQETFFRFLSNSDSILNKLNLKYIL